MEGIHLDVETPRLVKALATYSLLALVLLALAAVYLIWRIYRPFRALLDSLISQKNPGYALADRASLPPNRSRCAAASLAGDREQNQRLRDILQSVGASLSEHLFKGLLTGSSWEEGAVRRRWSRLKVRFHLTDSTGYWRFITAAGEHGNDSPVDAELYGLQG